MLQRWRFAMPYLIPDLPLICPGMNGAVIEQSVIFEEVIKRSRFITCIFHADSREGVLCFAEAARRHYPNATHYCWAYAAGAPGDTARIGQNDDGEPHGTAGRPMLSQLLHCGMGEVAALVIRYFGGVKLGTGGLARAYQNGVKEALLKVHAIEKKVFKKGLLMIDYAVLRKVQSALDRCGGRVLAQDFTDRARLTVELPEENVQNFGGILMNAGIEGTVAFD